jgi:hypothetical protein
MTGEWMQPAHVKGEWVTLIAPGGHVPRLAHTADGKTLVKSARAGDLGGAPALILEPGSVYAITFSAEPVPLAVGDILHGSCAGAFGNSRGCKQVEAVGTDFVVAREFGSGYVAIARSQPPGFPVLTAARDTGAPGVHDCGQGD